MKKSISFLIALSFIAVGCSESTEHTDNDANGDQAFSQKDDSESLKVIQAVEEVESDEEAMLREDWERFKVIVLEGDSEGLSAFGESDNFEAEAIIESFKDPDFTAQLKESTFEDLVRDTNGDVVTFEFSVLIEGDDGEGNTFESGLYLYFYVGDNGLVLENFLAAG